MKKRNANAEGEALRLGNPGRFWGIMALLWGLLLLALVLNVNIGSVSIRADEVFSILWDGIRHGVGNGLSDVYVPARNHSASAVDVLAGLRIKKLRKEGLF